MIQLRRPLSWQLTCRATVFFSFLIGLTGHSGTAWGQTATASNSSNVAPAGNCLSESVRPDFNTPTPEKPRYAIVLHGGAGSAPSQYSKEKNAERRKSLENALNEGLKILKKGGPSLDEWKPSFARWKTIPFSTPAKEPSITSEVISNWMPPLWMEAT